MIPVPQLALRVPVWVGGMPGMLVVSGDVGLIISFIEVCVRTRSRKTRFSGEMQIGKVACLSARVFAGNSWNAGACPSRPSTGPTNPPAPELATNTTPARIRQARRNSAHRTRPELVACRKVGGAQRRTSYVIGAASLVPTKKPGAGL